MSPTLQISYLKNSNEMLWDKTHEQILANKYRQNANFQQIICYLRLISLAPQHVLTLKSVFSSKINHNFFLLCMCFSRCIFEAVRKVNAKGFSSLFV